MRLNKKQILSLAILSCFVLTSVNTAEAFSLKKNKNNTNNTQVVTLTKTNKKQKKGEMEQPPYTNEVHSVFSLNDCIENAIKYNPGIWASIYEEEAYKTKIGQAWANYFPSISAGLDISRSGNKYIGGGPYGGAMNQYTTMGYIPSVSADMLIFDFGKTKASADRAKRMYESKVENTKENINNAKRILKKNYQEWKNDTGKIRIHTHEETKLQKTISVPTADAGHWYAGRELSLPLRLSVADGSRPYRLAV